MSKAIDKVKAHYDGQETRKRHVPEWDLDVFCTPATLSERGRIAQRADGDVMEMMAYAIIVKAKDAEGSPLFDLGDKKTLMTKADAGVVMSLGTWLLQTETEDAEKN